MINAIRYIGFFFLLGSITSPLHAQFINLQLKVEPELSATVEQNLDFGTQVTNSGRTTVQLGDVNMGVFSIRAFHTQNLYISLQYPDQFPLELDMAYNNQGTNDATNANLLDANRGLVSIHERTQAEFDQEIWKEMYIYVFGAIDVGNIPNGVYTADIILTIDYD